MDWHALTHLKQGFDRVNPLRSTYTRGYEAGYRDASSHLSVRRLAEDLLILGVGAAVMYFLDPRLGRGRRNWAGDKVLSATRQGGYGASRWARYTSDRVRGLAHDARGRLAGFTPVDDRTLVERVRAQVGRAVHNAHAIRVTASEGVVTLEGPVLYHQAAPLVSIVRQVPGVRDVENALSAYDQAGSVPDLQGATQTAKVSTFPPGRAEGGTGQRTSVGDSAQFSSGDLPRPGEARVDRDVSTPVGGGGLTEPATGTGLPTSGDVATSADLASADPVGETTRTQGAAGNFGDA
jgi:hypothetical protein